MVDDEITLPFIFVADGADPPPELADFKSAHPDWVSFPATFAAHEQPLREDEVCRTRPASEPGVGTANGPCAAFLPVHRD